MTRSPGGRAGFIFAAFACGLLALVLNSSLQHGPSRDSPRAVGVELLENGEGSIVERWESLLSSDLPADVTYDLIQGNFGSDLSADSARRVSQLAATVVRATATGEGRERFPSMWTKADEDGICCSQIQIHATGAARSSTAPNVAAEVLVVWSSPNLVSRGVTRVCALELSREWMPITCSLVQGFAQVPPA